MIDRLDIVPKSDYYSYKECFVHKNEDYCIVKHMKKSGNVIYSVYRSSIKRKYILFGEFVNEWHNIDFGGWFTREAADKYLNRQIKDEKKRADNLETFDKECINNNTVG